MCLLWTFFNLAGTNRKIKKNEINRIYIKLTGTTPLSNGWRTEENGRWVLFSKNTIFLKPLYFVFCSWHSFVRKVCKLVHEEGILFTGGYSLKQLTWLSWQKCNVVRKHGFEEDTNFIKSKLTQGIICAWNYLDNIFKMTKLLNHSKVNLTRLKREARQARRNNTQLTAGR